MAGVAGRVVWHMGGGAGDSNGEEEGTLGWRLGGNRMQVAPGDVDGAHICSEMVV